MVMYVSVLTVLEKHSLTFSDAVSIVLPSDLIRGNPGHTIERLVPI